MNDNPLRSRVSSNKVRVWFDRAHCAWDAPTMPTLPPDEDDEASADPPDSSHDRE